MANFPGTPRDDTIHGTQTRDTITGRAGNDFLDGRGGDDRIEGGRGYDYLDGGEGADTLLGGADGDTLQGREGSDRLEGGAGNDFMMGDAGSDTYIGGSGDDFFADYELGDADRYLFSDTRGNNGWDTLYGWDVGWDQIRFSGYTPSEMTVIDDPLFPNDPYTRFDFDDGGQLFVENNDGSQPLALEAGSDFLFV